MMDRRYTMHVGVPGAIGYYSTEEEVIGALVCARIPGATIRRTIGVWKGKREYSLEVVVYASSYDESFGDGPNVYDRLHVVAKTLCHLLEQDEIWIAVERLLGVQRVSDYEDGDREG